MLGCSVKKALDHLLTGTTALYFSGFATSDLVDERLCFGLPVDVCAQLDQTLGHRCVSVFAGLLQHAVVQLRVAPHLKEGQAHRLPQLAAVPKGDQTN